MNTKLFKILMAAMVFAIAFVGCEKNQLDKVPTEKVNVTFKATNGAKTKSSVQPETRGLFFDNIVNIKSFIINVDEIEFDIEDDDDLATHFKGAFRYTDDIKLKGPFMVDLIVDGNLQINRLISNLDLPVAAYEEIEFEMTKCLDKNSAAYGQSIRIEGEILGTPFIFASDKKFDFEIDFDKPFIPGKHNEINVNFYLNRLFTAAISGIDFTKALELKHNGKIEIYYTEDASGTLTYEFGKKIWDWLDKIVDCEDFDD